jgi:hypothetical protein
MKKILLIFALLITQFSLCQTTILTENFGSPTNTTLISAYTGWQSTSPITFDGNVDVRNTAPSTNSGASGGGNVFFTNNTTKFFTISGINTSMYNEVFLTLNHHKSTTTSSNELIIEVSSDGINYTQLTYTRATGTGTAVWRSISPSGNIPITTNLRIRFRQNSTAAQFRIDDVMLYSPVSLPVELTYFDGIKQDGFNLLKWQTASEHNSSHFIVEKSTTGDFENSVIVGNIIGSGYSQEIIDYDLLDMKVENAINYYRLIQYDFDGEFKVYPIIGIDNRVKKDVVKIVDLTGREVNQFYKGWVIIYYNNGETFKTYQY